MAHYSELRNQSFEQSNFSNLREVDSGDLAESECPEDELFLKKSHSPASRLPSYCRHYKAILAHFSLAVMNIVFGLAIWLRIQQPCPYGVYGPGLVQVPAKDAITYEIRKWDHTNTYFRNDSVNPHRLYKEFGPPSPEVDAAWENLIQYQNIRLSKDELGSFRDTPGLVEFADGSGYYATLSAYHSLHCIKRIHHFMYFDDYYPGKTGVEAMLIRHHTEHCLNILLQTVKCNPDLSVFPMQWGAGTRIPIGLDTGDHQCMSWEKIDNWMKERSVNVYEPGLLVHPSLGEAYANGTSDETGIALDHLLANHEIHDHGH